MNLEYAAYLLNENSQILNEDAGSEGQKGARKWFEKNKPNMELAAADSMTPEEFQRKAETEFGHPINDALMIRDKNVYKYLPGAVRIAVTDCGWLTEHEDKKMMEQLQLIYAYVYLEWKDGIANGLPGPQRGQPYAGKYNRDMNGLTFAGIYSEIGSAKLAETKQRLQSARAGADPEEVERRRAEEAEAERRRAEEEAIRNSSVGAYHIEYIPNYEESHKWFEYTNPLSTQAGCHWCITQSKSHWDSYISGQPGTTVYFCWKAESLQALKDMNEDQQWFDDWASTHDIDNAPRNDYGLSLICIMVTPDGDGSPKFRLATSRYNHYGPNGQWCSSRYYGDNLVAQGDMGQICSLLGITAAEFKQKFKIRANGNTQKDHTSVLGRLNEIRQNPIHDIYDVITRIGAEKTATFNNIIVIEHQREYNFLTADGTLLSPMRWFSDFSELTDNNGKCYGFKVWFNGVVNIMKLNGEMMLARNVDNIIKDSEESNYVRIRINQQGTSLYNLLNLKTGNLMLRKPVADIFMCKEYYNSIPVKETESGRWIFIDHTGKKLNTNLEISKIYAATKYLVYAQLSNEKNVIINKKNNKIIYRFTTSSPDVHLNKNYFRVSGEDGYGFSFYDLNGERLLNISRYSSLYKATDDFIIYKDSDDGEQYTMFDVHTKTKKRLTDDTMSSNITSSYKNAFTTNRKNLYINGECVTTNLSGSELIGLSGSFSDIIFVKSRASKRLYNLKTGELLPININELIYSGDNYMMVKYKDQVTTYDTDFNKITSTDGIVRTQLLNFDSVLVVTENGSNIINEYGEEMFDIPFTKLLTPGFSDDGIASIDCKGNMYYINTDGDVSRALELISEGTSKKSSGPVLLECFDDVKTVQPDITCIIASNML